MWFELERLIEQRCARTLIKMGGTDQAASDALIAVYGALSNCQLAFGRMAHRPSPDAEADAVLAMDVVLATLHNVQPVLNVLDAYHAIELGHYVHLPAHPTLGCGKSRLKRQVELLRRLLELEPSGEAADHTAPTAFGGARRRLARFIRSAFSHGELFAA